MQDLAALQRSERPDPARLRQLVAYALGAQLPGPLSRSAAFLRHSMGAPDLAQVAVRRARLQQAALCSLQQSMAALDERVFEHNDLLAVQAQLARRTHELFGPRAPQRPYAETVAGWREVIALVGRQEQLLDGGESGWMMQATAGLGPVHDALLARITQVGLLGPEAAQLLRRQSADALQRLRRQLAGSLASGTEPGLIWVEREGRLVLSPQRLALRDELAALLREPFMAPPLEPSCRERRHSAAGLGIAAPGSRRWPGQRCAIASWPSVCRNSRVSAQPAVARVVDRQFGARVEETALGAMSPASGNANLLLDAPAWRSQRQQLARVQTLLAHLGARAGAERLRALAAADAAGRLALADQALAQTPLYAARTRDFGWWQGDGSPILQAFEVSDAKGLRRVLAQQFGRLDALGRQAAAFAQAPLPGTEAQAARWQSIAAELARYRAGSADSSVLALERYLVWMAPDLRDRQLQRKAGVDQCARGPGQRRVCAAPAPASGGLAAALRRTARGRAQRRRGRPAAVPLS